MIRYIIILTIAIVFNALANILMKVGMRNVGKTDHFMDLAVKAVRQPALILGVFSFGLALLAYSIVLTRLNLSIAYPVMVSMGLIIVVTVSAMFLQETISVIQIVGFILIIAGVWLVAK